MVGRYSAACGVRVFVHEKQGAVSQRKTLKFQQLPKDRVLADRAPRQDQAKMAAGILASAQLRCDPLRHIKVELVDAINDV